MKTGSKKGSGVETGQISCVKNFYTHNLARNLKQRNTGKNNGIKEQDIPNTETVEEKEVLSLGEVLDTVAIGTTLGVPGSEVAEENAICSNLKQEISKHSNSSNTHMGRSESLTTDTDHDSSTTSTVNMLTSTKMLKIKQGKIDTRKRENRKIATKNLQLDTGFKLHFFYFYFSTSTLD